MSRHVISAIDPSAHSVVVGWDNPLHTFFADVYDLSVPEDSDDDDLLLSLGNRHDAIQTVEELQAQLSEYAVIPNETAVLLNEEKADGLKNHAPTPLQQQMETLAKAVEAQLNPKPNGDLIEVSKCQIDWRLGWGNLPILMVWVKECPNFSLVPHQKFPNGVGKHAGQEYDRFLYYAEVGGFVHKLHGNPTVNEGGYDDDEIPVLLEDGTTDVLLGSWDGAWSPHLPILPYHNIVLLKDGDNGRGSCYVTEAKYRTLVEQYCPEAELVPDPSQVSVKGELRIKRKGCDLNDDNHGTIPHSEMPYRGLAIKVFYVPETNEAIAEVWEPGKSNRTRTTSVCASPELALTAGMQQADKLVPKDALSAEEDAELYF